MIANYFIPKYIFGAIFHKKFLSETLIALNCQMITIMAYNLHTQCNVYMQR